MKKIISISLSILCILISVNALAVENNKVNSYADTTLRTDVLAHAQIFISAISKDSCKEALNWNNVTKTELHPDKGPTQAWEEVWYVNACQQTYPFLIKFMPDKTGTTFSVQIKQ
jgi:hypothetical protein